MEPANMHLSLLSSTMISTVGKDGHVNRSAVSSLVGDQEVYDWFGKKKKITIQLGGLETRLMTTATSGEMCFFGSTHSVLTKSANARWSRVFLKDIKDALHVKLPQKKIKPNHGMLEFLDIDDEGLFILVDQVSQFGFFLKEMAYCGVKVNRNPSQLRIELDRSRPPCFATKLLNGSFVYNLENTLGSLAMGGVVAPCTLIDDDYLKITKETGIIFEGSSIFNEITLLPAKALESKAETYHVYLEDQFTPIELDWFCS